MTLENRDFEEDGQNRQQHEHATMLALETLRSAAKRKPTGSGRRKEKISLFWQVFGGTILSIVALVILTAYSQMNNAQTDLRHEVSQLQVDLVKKDEFNARLTVVWSSIKDLQATGTTLAGLNEQTRVLTQTVGTQGKSSQDERNDLQRKIDELTHRVQTLAERLALMEGQRSVKAVAEPAKQ